MHEVGILAFEKFWAWHSISDQQKVKKNSKDDHALSNTGSDSEFLVGFDL